MRCRLSQIAALFLSSAWALAGPFDPVLVPPGADWVVHLDVETARKTSLGSFLRSKFEVEADRELAKLIEKFRINPLTDIHSVTVYGASTDQTRTAAIAIASSAADSLAEAIAESQFSDVTIDRIADRTFLKWNDGQTTWRAAVVPVGADRRAVVFARGLEDMEVALTQVASRKSGEVATTAWGVLPEAGSILFCVMKRIPRDSSATPEAQVLRSASSLHFDAGETAESAAFVTLTIEAGRPQDAMGMRELVGGLLALGRMSYRGDAPLLAKVESVASSVQLKVEGRTFSLRTRHSSRDLIDIIDSSIPALREQMKPMEAKPRLDFRRTGDEPLR